MAFKGILDFSDCRVDLDVKTECESDVNFIFIVSQVDALSRKIIPIASKINSPNSRRFAIRVLNTAGTNESVTSTGTTTGLYVVYATGTEGLPIGQSYQGGIIF